MSFSEWYEKQDKGILLLGVAAFFVLILLLSTIIQIPESLPTWSFFILLL
jgi:hypothetical protein